MTDHTPKRAHQKLSAEQEALAQANDGRQVTSSFGTKYTTRRCTDLQCRRFFSQAEGEPYVECPSCGLTHHYDD